MRKIICVMTMLGLCGTFMFAATIDEANKAYNDGDYTKALESYKKLCDAKEAKACSSLGYMYRNAKGVSENATLSQEYYKKACNLGDKEACTNANW
ncbi:hypothetical protein NHP164001_16770 [Helicobacter trogontum]|uniref:Beta-lactamase n=1 Tax=Helicobacter trogontum TaxID=50960 RepID=A0ABQ0D5M2_9HELI